MIHSYYNGHDTFCMAGIGAQKSLTFTLCPLVMDLKCDIAWATDKSFHHIVVVVQPLKYLMKNQLNKLCGLGHILGMKRIDRKT